MAISLQLQFPRPSTDQFFGLGLNFTEYLEKHTPTTSPHAVLNTHLPQFFETLYSYLSNCQGSIAIFSSTADAYDITSQLLNSHLKDKIFAHYSVNHAFYDSFHKSPWTAPTDNLFSDTKAILYLVPPADYLESIRFWKNNYPTTWNIILPYMPLGYYPLTSLEDPVPTFFWLMQYSGTMRMLPAINLLTELYQRKMIRLRAPVWYTTRYIANLDGKTEGQKCFLEDPVCFLMKERIDMPEPDIEELQNHWIIQAKNLPYYSAMYAHEFVDFSLMSKVKDLKCVVLLRDPRDMLISFLYRISLFPQHLTPGHPYSYQKKLRETLLAGLEWEEIKDRALNYLITGGVFSKSSFQFVYWPSLRKLTESFIAAWRAKNTYCVKYEDLRREPHTTYRKLLDWLNWRPAYPPISDEELEKIVFSGTFQAQTGGRLKDNKSNYKCTVWDHKTGTPIAARKGGIGQWKQEFSEAIKQRVKELIGNYLIELEYENSLDW